MPAVYIPAMWRTQLIIQIQKVLLIGMRWNELVACDRRLKTFRYIQLYLQWNALGTVKIYKISAGIIDIKMLLIIGIEQIYKGQTARHGKCTLIMACFLSQTLKV